MIKGYKVIEVEKGYRCPLCNGHDDCYYVILDGLLDIPICDGCNYEFGYYFLSPPESPIWFLSDTLPIWERVPILETITGISIHDLRLSYVLRSLSSYVDLNILNEKISSMTENMDEDKKKIIARKERHNWIAGIRHRKKLIRKILKLREKIQTGYDDSDILIRWWNKREENRFKCKKLISG